MLLEAKCSQIVYIVYVCQLSGILFFRIMFKCDLCHPMEYIDIPFVEFCAVMMCTQIGIESFFSFYSDDRLNESEFQTMAECLFCQRDKSWPLSGKNLHDMMKLLDTNQVLYIRMLTISLIADELRVSYGTLLNFIKLQILSYFGLIKSHHTLDKLILGGKVKGQRNRGR